MAYQSSIPKNKMSACGDVTELIITTAAKRSMVSVTPGERSLSILEKPHKPGSLDRQGHLAQLFHDQARSRAYTMPGQMLSSERSASGYASLPLAVRYALCTSAERQHHRQ